MRRFHIVLLLLLMQPFQVVWAAVAPICTHEAQVAAKKHFGHHEHRHEGAAASSAVDDDSGTADNGSAAYHADCVSCHLGASVTFTSPDLALAALPRLAVPGDGDDAFRSHVPSVPERPDRLELPAAARFAGGVEFRLLPS